MGDGQFYLDQFFRQLDELQKRDILSLTSISDDRPPMLRGQSGSPADVQLWMDAHRTQIADVLLRVVDPDDDEVSLLAQDLNLWTQASPASSAVRITMRPIASPASRLGYPGPGIPLTDLAVAVDVATELFIAIGRANRPLGHDVEPPPVTTSQGSIQFTVGGGLVASGLGLVVACSAGLIAAPVVAPTAGVLLAGLGLIDMAIGWKKSIAESRKFATEQTKLAAETAKLAAETAKLAAEARQLDLQASRPQSPNFAYSSLVPREAVIATAERWQTSEPYANHVLNRLLPIVLEGRRYLEELTAEAA